MRIKNRIAKSGIDPKTQPCLSCGYEIGLQAGSKEAICTNCGYKDPCCD